MPSAVAFTVPLRVRRRDAVLCVLVLTAGVTIAATPAHAVTRTSGGVPRTTVVTTTGVSTASVRDSVGVNVHMSYTDTGYANAAAVTSLLTGLGVHHVRDGLVSGRPDQVAALTRLGKAGVRSTLIVGGAGAPTAGQLSELHTLAPYLDGVEPTNEDDCSGDASWAGDLRVAEKRFDTTLAADPRLSRVPRLGPSFCRPGSVGMFGALDPGAGVVNIHDYSPGTPPELALESRVPATRAAQLPTAPVVITETGYQNATGATGWNSTVSEATAADYLLRSLLDARRIGVTRTYVYELLDEKADASLADPEQHFGLVRADGTVKPAYTALRNLLADLPPTTGSTGPTATIPVALLGGGALLRSLAIADPSGGGETLALWLAEPTGAPSATVSVRLPADYRASSRRPSRGNTLASLGTHARFRMSVGSAVTLLHLTPVSGASAVRWTCAHGRYAAAESGATLVNALGALGATPDPSLPDDLAPGVAVTSAGRHVHLAVPDLPVPWTVAVWERTARTSASDAPFLQVSGAPGALMRTYDLTDDLPTHVQLSAYGALPPGAGYGTETWAQAMPNTWHLLTLSNDGSTATFSVDGVAAGRVPSGPLTLSGIDVGDLGGGFRGSLGHLAVFPGVLDQARLTSLATVDDLSCHT